MFLGVGRKKKIIAVFIAALMMFVYVIGMSQNVFAASFDEQILTNGTNHTKSTDEKAALVISGSSLSKANGFRGGWVKLTQSQLDGITDDSSAKQILDLNASQYPLWRTNQTFSYMDNNEKFGIEETAVSGLNLEALVRNYVDASTKVDRINLYTESKSGKTASIKEAFNNRRSYKGLDDENGSIVNTVLQLKSGNLPSVKVGQYNGPTDKNKSGWNDDVKTVHLDAITTATQSVEPSYTATTDGAATDYYMSDVMAAGEYNTDYYYYNGDVQTTADLVGVPLKELVAYKGIKTYGTSYIQVVSKKAGTDDETTYTTIPVSDLGKYFLAYDGKENGSNITARTDFCVYGPGSTASKVKIPDVWGIKITNLPIKNKTYTVGSYKYKITKSAKTNGTVSFVGGTKKTVTAASIPATVKINGYTFKVTAIGDKALKDYKRLTKVTVGSNISKIGKYAFYGDKKLKSITIKSKNITGVGSGALKGIYKKAIIKVPSTKLVKYQKLFKNKGQAKTVRIKK